MNTTNVLRELIRTGKGSLGTRMRIRDLAVVELIGLTGMFDYVEFLYEYAPVGPEFLDHFARAVQLYPHMTSMIKLPQGDRFNLASQANIAGIPNVLFADPRSVEDVRQCVQAVRKETPATGGMQGVAMGRSTGFFVLADSPLAVEQQQNAVVAIMIEKVPAMEHLEQMLAVPGVDMVQFGPSDFSFSSGLVGQRAHQDVRNAEKRMIELALKAGIQPRAEINHPDQRQYYLDLGVQHFNLNFDLGILFDWLFKNGRELRKGLGLSPHQTALPADWISKRYGT